MVDQAAVLRHLCNDLVADVATVEHFAAVPRDQPQRLGEVFLHQSVAGLQRCVILEENGARARPLAEAFLFHREHLGQRRTDFETTFGQFDRRRDQVRQPLRSPALKRVLHAGDRARHADGEMRKQRPAFRHAAGLVQVHVTTGSGRSHLTEIERDVLAARGVVQHHEPAAAEVSGIGQYHRQRKADRHGCVDGVAAALEHVKADAAGQHVLGGDHAVLGVNRMEDILIVVVLDEWRARRNFGQRCCRRQR